MKLAIPEFNGRVSPVFDFCRRLLVIEVLEDGSPEMFNVDWSDINIRNRADRLKALKVDTLLCGGISRELAGDVERIGIRVIPWISGDIKEVLGAFLSHGLPDPRLTMPGCPGRRSFQGSCTRGPNAPGIGGRGRRWR
jgi:predicted Fe-Mo cluster-binding NifX family protein